MVDITTLLASAALATAIGTLVAILISELERRTRRASAHLDAFNQSVIETYRDAQFPSGDEPIIDGTPVKSIRAARDRLFEESESARTTEGLAEWHRRLRADPASPEGRLAYELSKRLNRLGLAVYTGLVPVESLLAILGDVIVSDWVLCSSYVESLRQREGNSEFSPSGAARYHRRFAEWIGLLAAVHMSRFDFRLSRIAIHDPTYAGRRLRALMADPLVHPPMTVRRVVKRELREYSKKLRAIPKDGIPAPFAK